MDLKLKKLKLRSIRFPIPEKPDKGEETEVTLLEAESEKLLNCADMTAQEMQEFYPQLLHPADPDQMDKAVEGKVNSLRRATFNLAKTYLKTYEISDELGARWKDAKPARRKRKRRLISPAPANALIDQEEDESNHFTKGLNIYKLLWVFYIGSFAGVIIELLWCFINEGYFESRNGLIYGPLNPLYGAGAAALSVVLYKFRNRGSWLSMLGGMVVGSAVEYAFSWVQELLWGSRSWDYSHLPFNINGRICLLYSFFWGLLGIFWIKKLYPICSRWILKIPNRVGKILTWIILAFFILDTAITGFAMIRWVERRKDIPAANAFDQFIDTHYSNERMERVFPNMVFSDDKNS